MANKFALFICLFLAVSIPVQSSPIGDNTAQLIERIITAITQLLSKVIDLVEQVLDSFASGNLVGDVLKLVNEVLVILEGLLDADVDRQTDLDPDGLKLYKCVSANWADLNSAVLIYPANLLDCLKPNLATMIGFIKKVLEDLKTVDINVQTTAAELDKCSDNTCMLGILLEIVDILSNIPKDISDDVTAIIKAWPEFEGALEKCSASSGTDTFSKLFKEFAVIAKCYSS